VPQQSARRRQVYFDLPDTRVPERSSKSGRFDLETAASERPHFWFSSTSHAVVSCGDVMKVELSGEKGTPAWVLVSYFDSRAAVAAKAVIANVRHASCAFVDHEASYELRVARIRRLGSGSQASTLQWFSSFGDLESVVARKGGAVEASYFDCRAACRATISGSATSMIWCRHASCAFVDHEASYELRVARIRRLGSGSQASTLQWFSSFGDLESVVARKGGAVEASYFDCRAACRALEAHEQCVQMLSRLQTGGPLFSEAQEVH